MTPIDRAGQAASASEIREIVGRIEDATVTGILGLGATREEILEAYLWLSSDDYLHRQRHHTLSGRAAQVFDLLEAELPEPDQAG